MNKKEKDQIEFVLKLFVKVAAAADIVLLVFALALFSSCGTKKQVVTVIENRTDTCYISKLQRDSIWLHDSIHVKEKLQGDTMWVEVIKLHTKYIEKLKIDTLYQSRIDSVYCDKIVTEYIAKPLPWYFKTLIWIGAMALLIIIIYICWQVYRFWKLLHPI